MPHKGVEQGVALRTAAALARTGRCPAFATQLCRKVGELQGGAAAQRAGVAQHMPQLADIARPAIAEQAFQGGLTEFDAYAAVRGFLVEDAPDQRQPVAAFA